MAKQTINIGSVANDGTGDPLRTAFDKINDNFDELYSDDLGDVGSIIAGTGISVDQATGNVTVTNSEPNATHTGDVTGATALTIAADAVDGSKIADNAVDHDQLANRYTATGSITTYTGAVSVDWATATNFVMGSSLTGAIEFDFTNFKTGQVLTIYNLTGSQTITLDSDAATSETFNKVGGNDYDGASTNVLIVECIDDDATAVFNYSILTYTSDTTP